MKGRVWGWGWVEEGLDGDGVCVKGKDSSLQMGGKGAISNQVPSAAQFAMGQNTSVIRFHVTIYPKSSAAGMRTKERGNWAALVTHQLCLLTSSALN